jgi:hypothetical protein
MVRYSMDLPGYPCRLGFSSCSSSRYFYRFIRIFSIPKKRFPGIFSDRITRADLSLTLYYRFFEFYSIHNIVYLYHHIQNIFIQHVKIEISIEKSEYDLLFKQNLNAIRKEIHECKITWDSIGVPQLRKKIELVTGMYSIKSDWFHH